MVLHEGKIAEMKTGEGKTLVATLPVYLNALAGNGRAPGHGQRLPGPARHRVDGARSTSFLGLSGGCRSVHGLDDAERQEAYDCRHHLRDQQRVRVRLPARQHEVPTCEELVQRELHYAIVDEVDCILIDEARTPLIISGPAEKSTDLYYQVDRVIPKLQKEARLHRWTRRRATVDPHRGGGRHGCEKLLAGRQPLRPREHRDAAPRQPGAQGARPLQDGRGLHRQGRRGHHRRRVHRPAHAGPALQRRAAPGHRGQGRRQDREREPDPGHDHLPELLPHVQEAGRHDRHGRHRGGGVPARSTSSTSSSIPTNRPMVRDGPPGRDLQDRGGEVRAPCCDEIEELHATGPAGAGRHHLHRRSPSSSAEMLKRARHPARGAQRQAP